MLTKEQILSALDTAPKSEDVPEWGGPVNIAVMSGLTRDAFNASIQKDQPNSAFIASLLVATLVDDAGAQIFTLDDVGALQQKSAAVTARLAEVAMELNGLTTGAKDAAAKNSEAAQSGASGSDSASTSASQ